MTLIPGAMLLLIWLKIWRNAHLFSADQHETYQCLAVALCRFKQNEVERFKWKHNPEYWMVRLILSFLFDYGRWTFWVSFKVSQHCEPTVWSSVINSVCESKKETEWKQM
jgi:hypothetical protein